MLEEHELHGDTYAQHSAFQYVIITRDTMNIRELLARQFKNFDIGDARSGCVRPLLGDSIFTQDGAPWDHSRKLLAPLIRRPDLSPFEVFEKHFQSLYSKIVPSEHDGKEVKIDLKEYLFDLTLSVITEFMLGPSASTASGDGQAFTEAFNTAFKWISKRERLKAMYFLIDSFEFRRSCNEARALVDKIVSRTSKMVEDSAGMESKIALFRLMRDDSDAAEVRDQFLSLLLAGRDTSGSLLCWSVYALSREPQVFTDLQMEVRGVLGDRVPTAEDFRNMKLLDQYMCEVLRLFPPVPINGRFCNTDTTLPRGGGVDGQSPILCPKGALVAFSTFAVHLNKDLWDDPRKFDVTRWSHERNLKDRITDWSYRPFSGGPRICLGEQFAVEEAKFMVCRLLQKLKTLTPVDPDGKDVDLSKGNWVDDVKYHVGLTMSPDNGVWVKMTPSGRD
ncbi:putative P450 monooxygenase [Lophiotrema nucula]|uniref:Putative P450 monooxygenase n=1 Tax=Lophiotrema nucula TaxID=690887 RepID=A0A6A5YT01_9PLEO|nr:putative P450 monooxygenase [Lophiotrema nucula]